MKIYHSYPSDIREACLNEAVELANNPTEYPNIRHSDVLAAIEILDLLESLDGPEKWARLNHGSTLSFFAFDPNEFYRQHPQVIIWCSERNSKIQYLLPHEHRPWEYAKATAMKCTEVADLTIDAFTRCESRSEFLIFRNS